jgi:hypothetical protein
VLHPATRAAIPAVLTGVESAADQYGWDQPPVVFGLFDRTDLATGAGSAVGALEVDPSLAAPDLWTASDSARPGESLPVPVVLRRFARQLATPHARVWLRDWLARDRRELVGFGLLFEGWAGPVTPGYRRGDLAKAPAVLRREVRIAATVDTDLGLHRVARVRHGQPSAAQSWPELPRWSQRRGVVVGLRALTELAKRV